LFVWVGTERRFSLFSKGQNTAVLSRAGTEVPLRPTNGAAIADLHGQYPTQSFVDPNGQDFDLYFNEASAVGDAIRYTRGSWRTTDGNGWERIEAASGLSTCIPLNDLPSEDMLLASRFDLLWPLQPPENRPAIKTIKVTVSKADYNPPVKVLSQPAITIDETSSTRARSLVPNAEPRPVSEYPISTPKNETGLKTEQVIALPAISRDADSSYYVQLASFLSEDRARKAWSEMQTAHAELQAFEPDIVAAQIKNKGLYFRVQIGGYSARSTAGTACRMLKSSGLDCFVTQR